MVRFGTFETNSSSAHTFVLKNDTIYVTDEEIQEYRNYIKMNYPEIPEGYIPVENYIEYAEYGRGFQLLHEWQNKMSYVLATYKYDEKVRNNIIEIIKKRTGCKGIVIPGSFSYYEEDENTSVPLYSRDDYFLEGLGSVDHQSYDNVDNAIAGTKKFPEYKDKTFEEMIEEIIFNTKFVIVVDSDESYSFDTMIENGMLEDDVFSYILEYKYDSKTKKGHYEFADFSEYETRLQNGGD